MKSAKYYSNGEPSVSACVCFPSPSLQMADFAPAHVFNFISSLSQSPRQREMTNGHTSPPLPCPFRFPPRVSRPPRRQRHPRLCQVMRCLPARPRPYSRGLLSLHQTRSHLLTHLNPRSGDNSDWIWFGTDTTQAPPRMPAKP
jgi:hypothetical protein